MFFFNCVLYPFLYIMSNVIHNKNLSFQNRLFLCLLCFFLCVRWFKLNSHSSCWPIEYKLNYSTWQIDRAATTHSIRKKHHIHMMMMWEQRKIEIWKRNSSHSSSISLFVPHSIFISVFFWLLFFCCDEQHILCLSLG